MKKKIYILLALITLGFGLNSCEDDVLKDYVPKAVIESYLIVGQPIENIIVMKSQPVFSTFNYEKALIRDAKVIVKGDGKVFDLIIDNTGEKGYYAEDKSYLVQPNTEYELEVVLNDGTVMTGKTKTPTEIAWTLRPKQNIQYPVDTTKLHATDSISWTKAEGLSFYMANIKCLDTLYYGKYLSPATNELNRRVYNMVTVHSDGEEFKEISESPFLANNQTSVVWNAFRWFGKHSVSIYAIDENMIQWYLQRFQFREFDERLNSIENGYGCFGSASMITDTFFLVKNQP